MEIEYKKYKNFDSRSVRKRDRVQISKNWQKKMIKKSINTGEDGEDGEDGEIFLEKISVF